MYAIYHNWFDPARHCTPGAPSGHEGEFAFIGTAAECAAEVDRLSAIHPEWRLSIHQLARLRCST